MNHLLKVLYIDDLDKINLFLTSVRRKERTDIIIFTASTIEEAIFLSQSQKDIKIVVLTKYVYRRKTLVEDLKKILTDDPEFIGVSSAVEIREALGSIGCNLVFKDRDELLDHIPRKHL